MDKPEGMPDDIWEMAEEISMNTANSYIGNTRAVAAAILKAKNDALEEAARACEDYEPPAYTDVDNACVDLAQAIRNLKHEG